MSVTKEWNGPKIVGIAAILGLGIGITAGSLQPRFVLVSTFPDGGPNTLIAKARSAPISGLEPLVAGIRCSQGYEAAPDSVLTWLELQSGAREWVVKTTSLPGTCPARTSEEMATAILDGGRPMRIQ